jgi:hypothetical protein
MFSRKKATMSIDNLIERLRGGTMRFDWSDIPDDALIPAVPLLREAAAALAATLEENRRLVEALANAAVAAYAEPHYLGPEGMERGTDGLLQPGSPYDRGRYDARKAIEALATQPTPDHGAAG